MRANLRHGAAWVRSLDDRRAAGVALAASAGAALADPRDGKIPAVSNSCLRQALWPYKPTGPCAEAHSEDERSRSEVITLRRQRTIVVICQVGKDSLNVNCRPAWGQSS